MFGTMFRVLLVVALAMLAAMLAAMMVKAAVVLLVFALTLLAPFLIVFWLIRYGMQGGRRPAPQPSRRARRRFRWEQRRATTEQEAEHWAREASDLAADIARLVRRGDRGTRQILSGAPAGAKKLAERVRDLTRLCKTLEEHLRDNEGSEFLRQAAEMQARADATRDPFAREQYAEAARSLEAQAQTCLELSRTRERLHAEIARILAALTNLRSRIVAVLSSPAGGAESVSRAADDLADLESQVGTFQESVRQVLRQASQPTR